MFRPEICFSFLILILVNARASKCPESRKPHPTNCSLFYNCVNLPRGGYVWVPSKCIEGLVFESYLQMCVLPSETWSCDSTSTESTIAREKNEAEVIKPYLDFNLDPLNLSKIVDSSYSIDSPTEQEINEETTPYLLNGEHFSKFTTENESANFVKKGSDIYDKSMEQHNFPKLENKTVLIRSVTWLDRMIDNLLIHQSLKILSDETFLVTNSGLKSEIKTGYSTTHKIKKDALHNQFVTNYISRNNFENEDASLTNEETTTSKIQLTDTSLLNQSVNESKMKESIIFIRNNLGDKQYITRQKYEFLKDQLNPDNFDIIPCSTGIRLPNNTDCTKYYICEVKTATVREFSCPSFTGFNPRTKICDTQTYSVCRKIKNENSVLNSNFEEENIENVKLLKKTICASVGKFADPSSLSHYYLCYLNGGKTTNVESVRMMCPNNLIFCAEKKLCVTKQFCAKYNSK